MFFLKIFTHNMRLALTATQITSDIFEEFTLVVGTPFSHSIAFYILIQHFIRIQFRAVTWKIKQANLTLILIQPTGYFFSVMNRMAIYNEKYFLFILFYQTSEKSYKHIRPELTFKHHKIQTALVGEGRNHITAETLAGSRNYRCLTTPTIGASCNMIRPETHLIAPVNQGLFLLGFFPDRRILFFKPTFHFCRLLLIRTAQWLLRRKTPTCEISTNRPYRKLDTKSLLYQLGHGFPSPKIKRKLELFRAMIRNGTDNLRCLPKEKCLSFRSTLPLGLETIHTA